MRSRDKLNTLYLHLQKTYRHKIGKVATYHEELPPLKPYDPFDHFNNMRSSGKLKTLYPNFHKIFWFFIFPMCILIYFAKFVIMATNSASYAHYLLCLRLLIVGNLIRLFLISIRSTRYVLFYVLFTFHFHFFSVLFSP